MSEVNTHNGGDTNRRSSITQAALSNLFQLSGSNNNGPADPQRRRLSITTLGLSGGANGTGANFVARRGSLSANSNNSDSLDESAIEDDEAAGPRAPPTTPFTRRMSYSGSMRGGTYRPGQAGSPGNGNTSPYSPPPPAGSNGIGRRSSQQGASISAYLANRRESVGTGNATAPHSSQASNIKHAKHPSDNASSRPDQQGFNWSEQLRSRAESAVSSGPRPSFSMASSPSRASFSAVHDRAKSVSDMPPAPVQAQAPQTAQQKHKKPDAFQERILKGDFYMD
ncbi:hypothetical protein GMORB2_7413 [Geosmithia morbida]|uniref:Uncharacterized protein n=1 Tax=Geosmithia morbida TaxID=1094350 RepID=A0A9P4YSQ6_9HYPO|nr:uncharacterized protein GMORB2_7413 [Geosmithia morbida]KAF4122421.1 hypothetical protein GMORB2_7413 [Geosmithia morbida]